MYYLRANVPITPPFALIVQAKGQVRHTKAMAVWFHHTRPGQWQNKLLQAQYKELSPPLHPVKWTLGERQS